jgi:hypothetical protein
MTVGVNTAGGYHTAGGVDLFLARRQTQAQHHDFPAGDANVGIKNIAGGRYPGISHDDIKGCCVAHDFHHLAPIDSACRVSAAGNTRSFGAQRTCDPGMHWLGTCLVFIFLMLAKCVPDNIVDIVVNNIVSLLHGFHSINPIN